MAEPADIHELAAGYVLDALDDDERARFEEHLRSCTICEEELGSLRWAATALAYTSEGVAPPPVLRATILEQAHREATGTVVSFRRRFALPAAAGLAAVAAAAAIVLAVWTASLSSSLDGERSARQTQDQALAIVASPGARRFPLSGARGAVIVTPERDAALVVSRLPHAPSGKTYEVWVSAQGDLSAHPAGLLAGGRDHSIVVLSRRVPRNARVDVSVEKAGGVQQLTGDIVFGAETA